jgi:hypothetical protein
VDDDMPEFDMPPDLVRSMAELSFRMEQRWAARNQEIIESKVNIISDDAFLCWTSEAPGMEGLIRQLMDHLSMSLQAECDMQDLLRGREL